MKPSFKLYQLAKRLHGQIPYLIAKGSAFPPLRLTFEITYRCNLLCKMCYLSRQKLLQEMEEDQNRKELTTEEIKKLIRQLPRFALMTYTGGEPLLRKDFPELLEFTSRYARTSLITSGVLISGSLAKSFIKSNLLYLGVSIDGPEKIHDLIRQVPGGFKKTIAGIQHIQEAKKTSGKKYPLVDIKTVIMPENVPHLTQIFDLADNLGADFVTFQMMSTSINMNGLFLKEKPSWWEKPEPAPALDFEILRNQFDLIDKKKRQTPNLDVRLIPPLPQEEIFKHYQNQAQIKNYICHSPWSLVRLSPYGDIYPCYNFKIGNIRETPLKKLWNHQRYKHFRRELKKHQIFPGCIGCCMLESKNNQI